MKKYLPTANKVLLSLLALAGLLVVNGSAQARRTPVEVFANGDDGLTSRLCDEIQKELATSKYFELILVDNPAAI